MSRSSGDERHAGRRRSPLARAYRRSRCGAAIDRTLTAWDAAVVPVVDASRTASLLRRAEGVVADASVVRWATREPRPNGIVVDVSDYRPLEAAGARGIAIGESLDRAWCDARTRQYGRQCWRTLHRRFTSVAGFALLVAIVTWLGLTWPGVGSVEAIAMAVLAALAVASVRSGHGSEIVLRSRSWRSLAALFAPPEGRRR